MNLICRFLNFLFALVVICNVIQANYVYAIEKNQKVHNNFAGRKEVQNFINYMDRKYNFDKKQLNELFLQYNTNQDVLKKISNPAEKLPWEKYKRLLISSERIKKGKDFIVQHEQILTKAEQHFGVPKEIIVAILGVESFYGSVSGDIPVIQSLATLSFDYPPREKFFRQELEQFLLLTREEKLDPHLIKGSYAGAMSPAQFISSSYRAYAIDFVNVGSKDLNNIGNAIGSIANYFFKHGWKAKQPIVDLVNIDGNSSVLNYLDQNSTTPVLKYTLKELKDNLPIELKHLNNVNMLINENNQSKNKENQYSLDVNQPAALMEFISENNNKEYWLGYNNFCVITKYNRSINYAMAVYLLSQQFK